MSNEIVKREENKIQINNEMSNMLSDEMDGLNIAFPIIKVPAVQTYKKSLMQLFYIIIQCFLIIKKNTQAETKHLIVVLMTV